MGGEPAAVHQDDAHWMRRALGLARGRAGRTWPNPTVGACVVRDGRLLAEAVHERAGAPHAEAAALADLSTRGISAAGATVYVTLEPCDHHGRTPPCTLALIDAGIARVVYAVPDVSPRAHGGGGERLRSAGIQVDSGLFADEAWELNHPFFETNADEEVHVTVKLALSLDGKVAPRFGRIEDPEQRRVTGPAAHRRVHRMRSMASAVMVGRGTVETDRPRLTARGFEGEDVVDPRPVVLDTRGVLDADHLPDEALVFTGPGVDASRSVRGIESIEVPLDSTHRIDVDQVFTELARRRLGVLLVEAGPTLAESLVRSGRAHRLHLFVATRTFGPEAPGLLAMPELQTRYRSWRSRPVGDDLEWVLRRRDLLDPVA